MPNYLVLLDGGNHKKEKTDNIADARQIAYEFHMKHGHDVIIWKEGKFYALVGSVFVKGQRHVFYMTKEKKYLLTAKGKTR